MYAIGLSESAQALLRYRLTTKDAAVTPENLPAYRELAAAGIMIPISTWAGGPESLFRFTEEGWNRREEWLTSAGARRP